MLLNGLPYGGVLGTIVPPQSGGRSCSQADVRSTGRSGWSAWRLHQEQGFSSTTWKTWGCRFCGRSGHWKAACTTGLLCFACRRAGAHCPHREEPPGRSGSFTGLHHKFYIVQSCCLDGYLFAEQIGGNFSNISRRASERVATLSKTRKFPKFGLFKRKA